MKAEKVRICNRLGLHARAAAKVVHTANAFAADIHIGTDVEEVNAKSILGLLTLAATQGTELHVTASGDDEDAAVRALVELFANKFGEGE